MKKKKLLIVESPAKIKTISKFLGTDFKIMSTIGHVKDLPKKTLGVTVNDSIDIEYIILDGKENVVAQICREAAKAETIYLAPDPDREGEIIAWHIGQEIEKVVKDKKKIQRITFNEITKPAILEAIENTSTVDLKKVAAQQARRVLDRWVGYEVSPILWEKITRGLSAGRVQSVALRLVCEREQAIRDFDPEEYWSIQGLFKHFTDKISAALTHIKKKKIDIQNKKTADDVVKAIKKTDFIVDSVIDKKRSKNPFAPFMTSTLQQAAFNRLGFTVKRTMSVAQKLYEGLPLSDPSKPVALITYMRTDSKRISDTAIKQVRGFISKELGKNYLPTKSQVYAKSKGKSQDAHEAIRPIDVAMTPERVKNYLPRDAARLYELIWRRFVACQMTPALYAQRQVAIQGGEFTFKITGSTLIFDGYLKVYKADEETTDAKVKIPKNIKSGDPITLEKIDPKQHFTQPPAKYTEGSLVKEMEKEGIGRPSTYAATLGTIQARSYVTLDKKKRFTPTELGFTVTNMLTENLPKIMDIKFTAHMEEDLDKIANGQLERDSALREFYDAFQKDLEKFRGTKKKKEVQKTDVLCPECKQNHLGIRFGKKGEFLGCLGYPDCKFTCNFERTEDNKIQCVEIEKPKLLDITCPKCGKNLREIIGKFGPFIACSGYPECKYVHREKANFLCPKDGGEILKRTWRGGVIWGCS
ncbi:type I DNA topoisomerase, partial [bacterium]|nr:type I DNA topoisomerase [bacterium]